MLKYIIFLISALLVSCRFPDDPNHTLSHIEQSQVLRVGFCDSSNPKSQKERMFLNLLSQELHARIQWINEPQELLYHKLEHNELDIVACAINNDSPWGERVTFSTPLDGKKHVLAIPQGENAWLHIVNLLIYRSQSYASR